MRATKLSFFLQVISLYLSSSQHFATADLGKKSLRGLEPAKSWPECYQSTSKDCDNIDFTLVAQSLWHAQLSDGSYRSSNWQGVGVGGSDARNADFTSANLKGASMNHMKLDKATLESADLTGTRLTSSSLQGANLFSAIMTDAVLTGVSFDPSTVFPDGKNWIQTNFFGSNFNGMRLVLDNQDVSDMNLATRFQDYSSCSFSRMKAHRASCAGCNLKNAAMWVIQAEGIDFSSSDLSNVRLDWSNLKKANFKSSTLSGTALNNANLMECNLIGANLSTMIFNSGTKFMGCTFDESTSFPSGFNPLAFGMIDITATTESSTWPSCYAEESNCDDVDFSLAVETLWSQTFDHASFQRSKWNGVGFGGSTARNCDFTDASFVGASANHVRFEDSILRNVLVSGTNFQFSSFRRADLTGMHYSEDTNFDGGSFDAETIFPDGWGWENTTFFGSNFKGMKLILDDRNASNVNFASLYEDYSGATFHRMVAHGASFAGCQLVGAGMDVIKAKGIDFSYANLTGVRLVYGQLESALFINAELAGASFLNSDLSGCSVVGADLRHAVDIETATWTDCIYNNETLFSPEFSPLDHGMRDVNAPTTPPTPSPTIPSLESLASNTMYFDNIECFPMGINLAGVSYWGTQLTFKNGFEESGGCCWPADAKVDSDGNLLEAVNDPSVYWTAGRNLLYRNDGDYPTGTYILRANGSGTINMAFDIGPSQDVIVPTPPEGVPFYPTPTAGGIQLTITQTNASDPVKDISFMLKEYDDELHLTGGVYTVSPFAAPFVDSLAGMNVIRFMDFGLTNGNNIVHWEDRTTTSTISQTRTMRQTWVIESVGLPLEPSDYIGPFALELTTSQPHGLTTGQAVTVEDLVGTLMLSEEGNGDFLRNLADVWFPKIVQVTSPTTFLIDVGRWDLKWNDSITLNLSLDASASRVGLDVATGVAYEYMMELSKEVDADPWICVPHLASDDYVRSLATLVATSGLDPLTSVYVELSNEVWNTMFSQQWHAEAMRRQLGVGSSSNYVGQRSREVFDIFQDVFDNTPGAPLLNRVLGTQSVNPWISEQVILGAGGKGSFDSLAIAPYFSAHASDVLKKSVDGLSVDGVTVTDVLELCIENVFTEVRESIIAQRELVEEYGGNLVAYEGGQHLGGQGPDPRGGRLENSADFQDLMIATNRDERMHNVYQAYFQQWGELVPGGVFAHFSFIGKPSKWGSWGLKESYFREDSVQESPKWMSVNGLATHCAHR